MVNQNQSLDSWYGFVILSQSVSLRNLLPESKMRGKKLVIALTVFVLCGGMAVFAGHGNVAAAVPKNARVSALCSRSFNPYKVKIGVLRSCGDKILWLQHVTPLRGGGNAYSYGEVTVDVPPAHFQVLRASDKQLAVYGIPTRKQLGSKWYGVMRHVRRFNPAPKYLVEVPRAATQAPAELVSRSPHTDDPCTLPGCSYNWAGDYVTGHTYNEVTVIWIEPSFIGAGCSGDEFAQWLGLGGTGSTTNLGQEGTFFNYPDFAAHQAFIETIIDNSGGPVPIKGLVVSHGNSLYGSVYWDSSSEVYDYFFSYNGNGYSEHSRTDESPDNSTAEVISERPDNPPTELSDFQTVSVENATSAWSSGSAGFVSNPHHYGITMEDTSGIVLADTSNLDSQSNFTNTWAYCS